MLPRSITSHPYFHNIKESEAREWSSHLPPEKGNCIFCFADEEKKEGPLKADYVCLYKSSDNSIINSIYFTYVEFLQASKGFHVSDSGVSWLMGRDKYSASLYEAVDFLARMFPKIKKENLRPILNPIADNQLKRFPLLANDVIAPLPNEVVRLIFDYLDLKSISNTSLVCTKWNSFFSANLRETMKLQHDEVIEKVNELIEKNEGQNRNRIHGGIVLE